MIDDTSKPSRVIESCSAAFSLLLFLSRFEKTNKTTITTTIIRTPTTPMII
jgi:hypothetical protein